VSGAEGPASGAELFLRALQARGTELVFMTPGTDTYPVQEAYARLAAAGEPLPRMVLSPFESLTSSAAQGAYLATGRAQVAFVHVDVGTANAAGSLNDAKGNRCAVVLCAGRSPISIEPTPGGRTKYINWAQDLPDQAALVRNYIKNEQVVYRPEAIPRTLHRAFQVAESDPAGPVYVQFPREGLVETTELGPALPAARFAGVPAGAPRPETVATVADWILQAEDPVVMTGYLGRDVEAVDLLVELSDLAGIGVSEYRGRTNFPLRHPHHLGFAPEAATRSADLLLVLEHDVPYVPVAEGPPEGTRLVHVGVDPVFENIPTWGFPCDLAIRSDSATFLRALLAELRARRTPAHEEAAAARSGRLAERHRAWSEAAWAPVPAEPDAPLPPALVGQLLNAALPERAVVFEEAVTSANPVALQLADVGPGRFFRNGGSYLGWALCAAVGYGMADPAALPVAVVGDGSFLFGVPSSTLWLARTQRVPLLTVVLDNAAYNSVRLAGRDGYPDGAQVRHGFVATDFAEPIAADRIAEACGVTGFAAATEDEARAALADAVKVVESGSPALVTIRTALSARAT
jgi:acetolactate synthase I/II/III large subunit